ncbi:hypothetical protein MA16_Dca015026 [Dendrobium catenatum]|uniref:Uncharacterized protein n=1 Tax=Dendrobium catenatum TaxID=906689 RepID=A0A2I0VDU7_9ASPA|nr:hypothetical protein MA16_Dca015026 [Dendrobium catenatum]
MSNRGLEDVGEDAFDILEKLLKAQPVVIDSNQAAKKYGGVIVTTKNPPRKMSKDEKPEGRSQGELRPSLKLLAAVDVRLNEWAARRTHWRVAGGEKKRTRLLWVKSLCEISVPVNYCRVYYEVFVNWIFAQPGPWDFAASWDFYVEVIIFCRKLVLKVLLCYSFLRCCLLAALVCF